MGNIAAPPQYVFAAYQKIIISACDDLDRATDGIVVLPDRYFCDMRDLIGFVIECFDMNTIVTVDSLYAEVIAKVLQGSTSMSGQFP